MGLLDRFRRKKKGEVSPGGSNIYRYEERQDQDKLHLPDRERVYAPEIEEHFNTIFPGRETGVIHEIMSEFVHIDLHVMRPTAKEPFWVVYTTGMSDLPMTPPPQVKEDITRAELYILLPGDWPLDQFGPGASMSVCWPVTLLQFLARFPHAYNTWLAYGHTVPNGADYQPFADDVGFGGVVLNWGNGPLGAVEAKDGQRVFCYQVVPCYKEEIEYKLKYGMDKLHELLRQHEALGILDPKRPNACPDFKEVLD